jgi:hypothetical protein
VSTEEPMSIEDRIRTATRAGATLVRDIGPMAAPEPARRRPAPAARRWGTWGIPLAAAAAVVLVAVSLVAVRQFGASAPSTTTGPGTSAPSTVPRYYAVLDEAQTGWTGTPDSGALIVGDDHTGEVIDTIRPPHGLHFVTLQGTSDDRTFVVLAANQAQPAPDYALYLLRIAPGTRHPYQLTKLSIKLPGSHPVAYALSPDDRELAVESEPSIASVGNVGNIVTLGIYSVSSGAKLRAWTADAYIASGPGQDTLSWLADGRQLVFSAFQPGHNLSSPYLQNQLRTLDVTGSGTDLMTASRALLTVKTPISSPSDCWAMHVTPDGGTVICGTQYALYTGGAGTSAGCANGGLEFTAYSVRTGKPVRVMYQYPGTCSDGQTFVLWTDTSARSIIGATEVNLTQESGKQSGQLGVISDGRIRLLKLPKSVSPTDYGTIAF